MEVLRKITLTSFVLLLPPSVALLRIVAALLLSVMYVVLLLLAKPHRDATSHLCAVVANISLVLVFVASLICKVFTDLTAMGEVVPVLSPPLSLSRSPSLS